MAIHKTQGSVGWVKPEDWDSKATTACEEQEEGRRTAEKVRIADAKLEIFHISTTEELVSELMKRFAKQQERIIEIEDVLRGVGWLD